MKHRPLRTMSILGLVATTVIALAYGLKYIKPTARPRVTTEQMTAGALEALDAGQWAKARELAADLRLRDDLRDEERGIPPYVLGEVMRHNAESEWQDRERNTLYLLAARYFEEARLAGVPAQRNSRCLLLLGESLRHCNRLADAIPPLKAVLEASGSTADETEACRLLSECYLLSPTPDLTQAAEFNRRYLSTASLPPVERDRALLTQARICSELGQSAACQQAIAQLRPESTVYGDALLLAARQRIRDGDARLADTATGDEATRVREAAVHFAAARQLVQQALESNTATATFRRQAPYLLGLALRRLGDHSAAEREFARTVSSQFDTPEGIAAGLELAEVLYLQGQDRRAVETYRRTFQQAADAKSFGAPWLSADELRRRVESTLERLRAADRLSEATELAEALTRLYPDARAVASQARFHRGWAEQLARGASTARDDQARELISQSRQQQREAGQAFERLARLRFATRSYQSDLWDSADSYLAGQDYDSVVRICGKFLRDPPAGARPAALVRIGEAELARNRPLAALEWLNECMEAFAKDPFVYRARLLAAEAQLELGELARAKELLLLNLENDSLTPASREWLDSLYLLGRTAFREGLQHETQSRLQNVDRAAPAERQAALDQLRLARAAFEESVRRLSEAVQRAPEAPQAIEARYLLAQAHLQSARLPKWELQTTAIEATRVRLRRELNAALTAAAAEFESLKTRLIASQENRDLTTVEERLLRNCYFARADAMFDLEKYDEALQAYDLATNRYQHEPEALEAFIQIANCQRKLHRPEDARRTIEQANLILKRMRPDADFLATTRYDRKEWNELLTWLSTL